MSAIKSLEQSIIEQQNILAEIKQAINLMRREKNQSGLSAKQWENKQQALENKINDKRLDFFLGDKSKNITFEETLQSLLGFTPNKESNITVIDLSGVPFEVLSITVSLISRLVFEYGYIYTTFSCFLRHVE